MTDFIPIYETNPDWADYLVCNHCGERVERGIVSVSHHWVHCLKRKDSLIETNDKSLIKLLDSWSINT